MKTLYLFALLFITVSLASCQPANEDTDAVSTSGPASVAEQPAERKGDAASTPNTTSMPATAPLTEPGDNSGTVVAVTANYGYTHQRPDGNRLVLGQGSLPEATVIDIALTGRPVWVVSAPIPETAGEQTSGEVSASAWAVVLEDGRIQAFVIDGQQVTETTIEPSQVKDVPPLLMVSESKLKILLPPSPVFGFAPPVVIATQGHIAATSPEGVVTVKDTNGAVVSTAKSPPLPDGRLLVDEDGRLLYLSQPTTRYAHGIAGDEIEAASITLFKPIAGNGEEIVISVPEPAVVEGIMPLWADLNDDGQREIIVTQSDAENGAQIVVYNESGLQIAEGPAIGLGNRWRHQLAVAAFGPQREVELVDVLTPHIGGVVEFYRMVGDELQIVASVSGYTSHVIGSRNLDMALAGDLDGDGQVEVLVPDQSLTHLGSIRRTAHGAEVAWTIPLEGKLSSNLSAVHLPGDGLIVGAGREDGTLRLWLP